VKLLLMRDDVVVNSVDVCGGTSLLWAARKGHEAVVKLLLARDDLDVNSGHYGRTALSFAAERGHEAVVKLLLAQDEIDVKSKDSLRRTVVIGSPGRGRGGEAFAGTG